MPSICLHMRIALEASERLGMSALERHLGSFLLGSTAPDVRVTLGWQRERTHFFDLAKDGVGAGVEGLFRAYPDLVEQARANEPTRAFLAGYITHLLLDETWIVDIYRPYFGAGSPLGGTVRANLLDRTLQYEMDRREREDQPTLALWRRALRDADNGVEVGFISGVTLQQWRDFVVRAAGRNPSWEYFRGLVERMFVGSKALSQTEMEQYLAHLPKALERLGGHVPAEKLVEFRAQATERSLSAFRTYLS
ncbi:MAG: zinc dependent phospholipase C family protein [Dehalococcoidia bacterium]|nr:zinc dependent phospholipase C family protein [Dehalococcoidia bacterium]